MSEPTIYRTIADADAYFSGQLYATDWTGATDADKALALLMATRAVDSLKFRGVKRSVWDALVADGNVDTTLTVDQNVANSELTEAETKAAYESQLRQFPRDAEAEAESWTLEIGATGGTFTLTLNGTESGAIAYDANAATIEAALSGVTVTGSGPFTLTMADSSYFNSLTSDATNLTGGASTATILTVEDNVPDDIFWAVCEEAKSLLSGRDAEQEFRNLELNSDGVGSNRVTMDRSGMPPRHTAHLVTSPLAWKYLQRYLAPNNSFTIKRT